MALLRRLKDAVQGSLPLRRLIYNPYLAVRYALPTAYRREWVTRIDDVLACPDLADIPRVPGAGRVRGGMQTMHNGLRVIAGGYYGYPLTRMKRLTGGVHEPQEEKAFGLVLPFMPANGVMIEMGAYWAFYSMWFAQRVGRGARNYVVEPLPNNLKIGRANFAANDLENASFHAEAVGAASGEGTVSVDDFVAREKIDFVHMLHADVQGYELDMLRGARRTFAEDRAGYVFISTHGEDLHARCRETLIAHGLKILADATPAQSYSFDGLLVARSNRIDGPDEIAIAHKS